jgi:hypothetical protein
MPGLARAAATAPIVSDTAVALGRKKEHLVLKCICLFSSPWKAYMTRFNDHTTGPYTNYIDQIRPLLLTQK